MKKKVFKERLLTKSEEIYELGGRGTSEMREGAPWCSAPLPSICSQQTHLLLRKFIGPKEGVLILSGTKGSPFTHSIIMELA